MPLQLPPFLRIRCHCGYDPSAPKMAYRIRSRERSGVIGAAAEGWEHMYVLA
ncbi:Uncharacterised protein [Mycobacteroides abscessus subsp. abscessus]|nr:hypothetical protein MA6G0212_4933 [Mycobacteroides abscessus 6G-0212]EIV31961.1 hypothetical protein MA3A0122S_4898 [Mycobacteroides abscessus 3A-0122-S]EIV45301.1 hypothetical protein MA3A0930R_5057 [Mycobacteroides abscessus 3A-0930-R]ETZ63290.1 hypothetical protein L836_4729 [Mycobacteroides abscessus MAB_110811_2726]ETZ94411.1 hypothetical protein L828_2560 [Mycobacteroides abscessus MAB_030201_1061]SHW51929.1 Uncharacterised protein [Mycobacteroides abscessus subsp. abscessus]